MKHFEDPTQAQQQALQSAYESVRAAVLDSVRQAVVVPRHEDPLSAEPLPYFYVFMTAYVHCGLSASDFLGLGTTSWANGGPYSKEQLQSVVRAACQLANITEKEFWEAARPLVTPLVPPSLRDP